MAIVAQAAEPQPASAVGGAPQPQTGRIRVVPATPAPGTNGTVSGNRDAQPALQALGANGQPLDKAKVVEAEAANLNLLGRAVWLMSLSKFHKHFLLADLETRVRPPIMLRQCRLFLREGRPFAFVTWAYVTEDVDKQFKATHQFRPDQWRCGPKPVFVDVVTPFGAVQEVRDEITKTVFEKAMPRLAEPTASPATGRSA